MQTIRFKKDVKLEEVIQQRNVQNEKEVIDCILRQMKNKNLKFTQFDKDSVLQLHQPLTKEEVEETYFNNKAEQNSMYNDDKNDSDREDDMPNNNTNEDKAKKDSKKQQKKNEKTNNRSSPQYQYYHMKFQFHDRNMTIDLHKKDRAYFSSFKTVTRDKREYEENKLRYQTPGVGKYYPKFKVVEQLMPIIQMSKAELNRTRNFVSPNVYKDAKDLTYTPSKEYTDTINQSKSKLNNLSLNDITDTQRSKSNLKQQLSSTLNLKSNGKLNLINLKRNSQQVDGLLNHTVDMIIEDHDQQKQKNTSLNNSSNINLTPYRNLIQKEKSQNSINTQPSPNKIRDGWNNAHGMLDLNKQSQRKFVFENLIRVNEQRFNYIQLPQIYSKNRKVTGDADFGKSSARRGLFKLPEHQPMYSPNFDLTTRKNPQLVNMNVKLLKDMYHNIE